MREIRVEKREVDAEQYRGAFADDSHVSDMIEESTIVYVDEGDRPAAVYIELDERLPQAVAALQRIKYPTTARTSGMLSTSRTFGYAPKVVVRGEETCRVAKLATEDPQAHTAIVDLATVVEDWYERLNPGLHAEHRAIVDRVLPDWRLHEGVFTSGIINRNNKLPYHYDRGNFAGCWSNMLVFKKGCAGGDLTCPELDLGFRLRDHSLLMFDGQAILHGVTPFRITRGDGYRFSIVFYSLQQMWQCDPKADIAKVAARKRTARERARFQ